MNRERTEDLKAFEQRLIECVGCTRASTKKWKGLLAVIGVWVAISIIMWWLDDMEYSGFMQMMKGNINLTLSCIVLFLLYFTGIIDRCNTPNIVTSRCRRVLLDYNMSCDEQGKLILKRKPSYNVWKPE